MKSIAEKLRLIRQEKGYSQQYIAQCLEVSTTTVSRIENHPEEVKLKHLSTLTKFYEVDLCNIFSNDENELEKELSRFSFQVNIPIDITSAQLFQIAKKLQQTEQLKK